MDWMAIKTREKRKNNQHKIAMVDCKSDFFSLELGVHGKREGDNKSWLTG